MMGKRVGLGYFLSAVLPVVALCVLMLRLFDPWTRAVSVGLYLAGVLALLLAIRKHAIVRRKLSSAKHHALAALSERGVLKKRAAASAIVFGAVLVLFPVFVPTESGAFLGEDRLELALEFDRANAQIKKSEFSVTRTQRRFARLANDVDLANRASIEALRVAWAAYLDHAVILDRLVTTHRNFYRLIPRSPSLADRAFLVGYHALVVQMNAGTGITRAVGNRPFVETILNESSPALGLPRGTYTSFQKGLTRAESLIQLELGYGYLKILRGTRRLDSDMLTSEHVHDLARATILLLGRDPGLLLDAPFDRMEQKAFVAWFPLQKGAAELISPVRTKKRENFISEKDLSWAKDRLMASDILLQRRNWYLTNLGIPGFWPHAALYVGSLAELDQEFGPETREVTLGLAPSAYLERHMPRVFSALTTLDENGRPPRVIEAIGEGVVLHPFEESGHADYMAAMRPRLSDSERLKTLLRAFSYYGKPYDYNFEFSTDDAVVCSELVYKALQNEEGTPTVTFPLTKQNGRFLLPPNDMARTFDKQYGTPHQQLDFVFFLDGNETLGRATFNDVNAFRTSWTRPKWDLVQP